MIIPCGHIDKLIRQWGSVNLNKPMFLNNAHAGNICENNLNFFQNMWRPMPDFRCKTQPIRGGASDITSKNFHIWNPALELSMQSCYMGKRGLIRIAPEARHMKSVNQKGHPASNVRSFPNDAYLGTGYFKMEVFVPSRRKNALSHNMCYQW